MHGFSFENAGPIASYLAQGQLYSWFQFVIDTLECDRLLAGNWGHLVSNLPTPQVDLHVTYYR